MRWSRMPAGSSAQSGQGAASAARSLAMASFAALSVEAAASAVASRAHSSPTWARSSPISTSKEARAARFEAQSDEGARALDLLNPVAFHGDGSVRGKWG